MTPYAQQDGARPAALITWGRIAGDADEFRAWQNEEHLPERAIIAGVRRCRRYSSVDGAREFVTLYEASEADVFDSDPYRQLLANPSAWTRAMLARPSEGAARMIAEERFAAVRGIGGRIGVWRFDRGFGFEGTLGGETLRATLAGFADHPALCALRLFVSRDSQDEDASAPLRRMLPSLTTPAAAVVAEGWASPEALRSVCSELSALLPGAPYFDLYQMEIMMSDAH